MEGGGGLAAPVAYSVVMPEEQGEFFVAVAPDGFAHFELSRGGSTLYMGDQRIPQGMVDVLGSHVAGARFRDAPADSGPGDTLAVVREIVHGDDVWVSRSEANFSVIPELTDLVAHLDDIAAYLWPGGKDASTSYLPGFLTGRL